MTQDQASYILQLVGHSDGDDLERAANVFGRMTEQQLDTEWGISGQTARQIWDDYKMRRAKHISAYKALVDLLSTSVSP